MSTSPSTYERPRHAHGVSVALTFLAVALALFLAPAVATAEDDPLPTGTYAVTVVGGEVVVAIDDGGRASVSVPDGLVVHLQRDERGRVTDTFLVSHGAARQEVTVDVAEDGTWTHTVEAAGTAPALGAVAARVAECAPTGLVPVVVGLPNHGTVVSIAANGLELDTDLTDPLTGEVLPLHLRLHTPASAEAFCGVVERRVPSLEQVRAALAEQRAAARADLDAAAAAREAAAGAQED